MEKVFRCEDMTIRTKAAKPRITRINHLLLSLYMKVENMELNRLVMLAKASRLNRTFLRIGLPAFRGDSNGLSPKREVREKGGATESIVELEKHQIRKNKPRNPGGGHRSGVTKHKSRPFD